MKKIETQNPAERVALLLRKTEKENDDFLRSNIEKINRRLDDIESNIAFQNTRPEIQNLKSNHPSLEKFFNLEELAVEIADGLPNEKICPFEPTGKLCDHCSMCGSLGF